MPLLHKTPLYQWHEAHGAVMMDCTGWVMPRFYKTGSYQEHLHTRNKAGVFDRCHVSQFLLSGKEAEVALEAVVAANISTLKVGRCRYAFMLNEQGGIKGDLLIYRFEQDSFMLVAKPQCQIGAYQSTFLRYAPKARCCDVSIGMGKVDIQGPQSFSVLSNIIQIPWKRLPFYGFIQTTWKNIPLTISRTGYTGELGAEMYLPREHVREFWETLVASPEVLPVGVEARGMLRLESGTPSYGTDLDETHTPAEAGFSAMLTSQAAYAGKDQAYRVEERLTPLILAGKEPAASGALVYSFKGKIAGKVTSSIFSPCTQRTIAFSYIRLPFLQDGKYRVDMGKSQVDAHITTLPFYTEGTARNLLF